MITEARRHGAGFQTELIVCACPRVFFLALARVGPRNSHGGTSFADRCTFVCGMARLAATD